MHIVQHTPPACKANCGRAAQVLLQDGAYCGPCAIGTLPTVWERCLDQDGCTAKPKVAVIGESGSVLGSYCRNHGLRNLDRLEREVKQRERETEEATISEPD